MILEILILIVVSMSYTTTLALKDTLAAWEFLIWPWRFSNWFYNGLLKVSNWVGSMTHWDAELGNR
jgi:hypothetical protein